MPKSEYVRPTYEELVSKFGEAGAQAIINTWAKEDARRENRKKTQHFDIGEKRSSTDGSRFANSTTLHELPVDVQNPRRGED